MLAKIRVTILRYKLSVCMAAFFMMLSCSEEMGRSKNIDQTSLSAQDYFRAVYFLDGPLAEALGEYSKLSFTTLTTDKSVIGEVRDFENKVMDYIDAKNPMFFTDFKQKITSGDYSLVRTAVKSGIKQYLEALNALSDNRIAQGETSKVVEKYLAKYGTKSRSTAELVSNIKSFSQDMNKQMENVADPANEEAEKRMVSVEQYFWLYIDAAAAVVVIIVIVLATPEESLAASNSLLAKDDSYVFEDYVSTITTNLAAE